MTGQTDLDSVMCRTTIEESPWEEPGVLDWSGEAFVNHADPDSAEPPHEETILSMSGMIVDLYAMEDQVLRCLDGVDADYYHFGVDMFDRDNKLRTELANRLQAPAGGHVVLINRVRLATEWRGRSGIGRLLIGRTLRMITPGASVVATAPAPLDLVEQYGGDGNAAGQDPMYEEQLARIQRVWGSLAFEQFTDRTWIMDPAMVHHDNAVKRFAASAR